MAKDVKFNIKLTIDGKQVVVQCKNDVRALGEALTGVSAKARKADAVLSRLTSVSTLLRNGLSGFQQLGSAMQPYINKANAAATAQTKLTTVMRQRMNATEADVAAVNKMVALRRSWVSLAARCSAAACSSLPRSPANATRWKRSCRR